MFKVKQLKVQPTPWLKMLLEDERLRGLRGERGERGLDGANGSDGLSGVDGRDGLPGERGERGLQGEQGLRGPQGEAGERGLDGANGEAGAQGERGLQGEAGAEGKRGPKGAKGDKGNPPKHQIEKRAEGDRIRFERPDGTWGGWVELRQIVKYVNSGGGGGTRPSVLQDIEAIRAGKYPDYSRVTVVTANVTLTDFHRIVVAKTNALTVTLPPAATYFNSKYSTGIIYTIANDKANTKNVVIAANGSELIDDANTWTVPPGAAPKIVTDGSKWHII